VRTINVLLEVNDDNEPGIGEIDYAVINMSESMIEEILMQMDEIKARDDVDGYKAYDYSPTWLGSDERKLWKALREGATEDVTSTDGEMRRVDSDSVSWVGYYKHCNVTFSTRYLEKPTLEKLLAFCKGDKDEDQLDFTEAETEKLNLNLIKELDDEFGKKAD